MLPPRQVKKHRPVKQRGRRGWGGPWRAFVRMVSFGRRGSPKLDLVAADYHARQAAGALDVDRLRHIGEIATRTGKLFPPRPGNSSFGPKGRHIQRNRLKELREALCNFAAGCDKDARPSEVGVEVLRTGMDLDTCLSLARAAIRIDNARARERQAARRAALEAFENGPGKESVRSILQAHPSLAGASLRPVPSPKGVVLMAEGCHDLQTLHEAVAWARWSKASALSGCLAQSWDEMHRTVMEDQCGPCNADCPPPSECLLAGMCVCSGDGKELKKLRSLFLRAMKTTFPPTTPQRSMLLGGGIVVRMTSSSRDPLGTEGGEQVTGNADLWLHIGMMYLTPYRPTLLQLEEVPRPEIAPPSLGSIYLKVVPVDPTIVRQYPSAPSHRDLRLHRSACGMG